MRQVFETVNTVPSSIPRAVAVHSNRQRVDSRDLLQGGRELIIQHGDQEYRLRHTQNDKLILTK